MATICNQCVANMSFNAKSEGSKPPCSICTRVGHPDALAGSTRMVISVPKHGQSSLRHRNQHRSGSYSRTRARQPGRSVSDEGKPGIRQISPSTSNRQFSQTSYLGTSRLKMALNPLSTLQPGAKPGNARIVSLTHRYNPAAVRSMILFGEKTHRREGEISR